MDTVSKSNSSNEAGFWQVYFDHMIPLVILSFLFETIIFLKSAANSATKTFLKKFFKGRKVKNANVIKKQSSRDWLAYPFLFACLIGGLILEITMKIIAILVMVVGVIALFLSPLFLPSMFLFNTGASLVSEGWKILVDKKEAYYSHLFN